MAQLANIVAFDGAPTPVSHTFVGESVMRDSDGTMVADYKESLAAVPDYAQIRVRQTKRKLKSGVFRVSTRVEVPVMEAINAQNSSGYTAPPKVAYVDTVEVIGFYHQRSVVTGRRLARQLAVNIANGVATSVVPNTTSATAELFDQLIMPT